MSQGLDRAKPKLLEQVRQLIRIRHYSIRTEEAYLQWIRRYILFHGKRHPADLGSEQLTEFLSDLAVRGQVAAATQNQALNAILFLYREVLKIELPWIDNVQSAKRVQHIPVVLTRTEVRSLLAHLEGVAWLMGSITYGGGLRLLECLRLRIKDLDFDRGELTTNNKLAATASASSTSERCRSRANCHQHPRLCRSRP